MNLLAISYMLPPNLYPQAIQIGRLIYNIPARVGAICGTPKQFQEGLDCYSDFDQRLAFRLTVPHEPVFSGLLHRLAIYGVPFYGRSPDEFRGWVPKAERAALGFLPDSGFAPDALISFGQPWSDHLLGLRLKKYLGLPWIAHFSDPWTDAPFNRRFFLANIINRPLEAGVVRHADRVIFTSEETLDLVMSKYPSSWRVKARVLPHGYEPDLYLSRAGYQKGSLILRYVGNFGGNRSPEPLFEALAQIYRETPAALDDISVELVGWTPSRMLKSPAYRCLPAGVIKIIPTVVYSKSLEMMKEADLLLVIDAPAELSVFLPSKLVDYLGAGVPILGIVPPGASAKLIGRLGGKVADPSNLREVASALACSIDICRARRTAPVAIPWGNESVRAEYRADRVAQHLHHIVEEMVV